MSGLQKAVADAIKAFDGLNDIGMEQAMQSLRRELNVERQGARSRVARSRLRKRQLERPHIPGTDYYDGSDGSIEDDDASA